MGCTSYQPCHQGKELLLSTPEEVPGIILIVLGLVTCPLGARVWFLRENWKMRCKVGKIVDVHYILVAGKLLVKGTLKYVKHFIDL